MISQMIIQLSQPNMVCLILLLSDTTHSSSPKTNSQKLPTTSLRQLENVSYQDHFLTTNKKGK